MKSFLFVLLFLSHVVYASPPGELASLGVFKKTDQGFILWQDHHLYNLNTTLFSDYAKKFRTIHIPEGEKIGVQGKHFVFPVGTIISKTFFYDPKDVGKEEGIDGPWGKNQFLIETRILRKLESGWEALVYEWDLEKQEAYYNPYGKRLDLHYKDKGNFSYFIPDKNQCMSCHITFKNFEKKIAPIGPKEPLNFNFPNQIAYFKELGLLSDDIQLPMDAFPVWNDPHSGNLDSRAKAYLHVNCAHCHSASGPAANTGLYLNYKRKNSRKRGFCKAPVAPGIGSGGRPFAIYPGKADQSILQYRIESRDLAIMMPEIGRDLIHKEGVDVVGKWINSLQGECL